MAAAMDVEAAAASGLGRFVGGVPEGNRARDAARVYENGNGGPAPPLASPTRRTRTDHLRANTTDVGLQHTETTWATKSIWSTYQSNSSGKGTVRRARKIFRYRRGVMNSFRIFTLLRGTVAANSALWMRLGIYMLVYVAMLLVGYYTGGEFAEDIDAFQNFLSLPLVLGTLLMFLLALVVQWNLDRWWNLRIGPLQGVWDCCDELSFRLALLFPDPTESDVSVKETALRYAILSIELLFKEVQLLDAWTDEEREEVGIDDLSALVSVGLLTSHEADLLTPLTGKCMVVWVWTSSMFTRLALDGRLPFPQDTLNTLHGIAADAREHLREILSRMEEQMPFPLTHQLGLMVKTFLFLCSFSWGFLAGSAILKGFEAWVTVLTLAAVLLPLFFEGLMIANDMLSNPFGYDAFHFPLKLWQSRIENECRSFFRAGETPPYGRPAALPPQRIVMQVQSAFLGGRGGGGGGAPASATDGVRDREGARPAPAPAAASPPPPPSRAGVRYLPLFREQ